MTVRRKPPFATEAELCAAFIAAVEDRWIAYAETEGWDILLVSRANGVQIGIQAKLTLNAKVIAQAAESSYQPDFGPDFRAILVPNSTNTELEFVSGYCGITVLKLRSGGSMPLWPPLPQQHEGEAWNWYPMLPVKRVPLPEYVPDVPAGAPAPLQLSQWKVKAMRLAVLMENTGYLTRQDFKTAGVDIRRWISGSGWLVAKDGVFVKGPRWIDFSVQHPVVWQQIKDDETKWAWPRQQSLGAAA